MHRCKLIVRSAFPIDTEPIISYEIKSGYAIETAFRFCVELKDLDREEDLTVELYHDVVGTEEVPVYNYVIREGPEYNPRRYSKTQRAGSEAITKQASLTFEKKLRVEVKVIMARSDIDYLEIDYEDLLITLPSSDVVQRKERRFESHALLSALNNPCAVCCKLLTNVQDVFCNGISSERLLRELLRAFTTLSSSKDVCDFIAHHKYVPDKCSLYDYVIKRVKQLMRSEGSHKLDWIQTFCKDFRHFYVEGFQEPEVFLSHLARYDLTDCLRMVPGIPRLINCKHTFYTTAYDSFVALLRKLFVILDISGKKFTVEFFNTESSEFKILLFPPLCFKHSGEDFSLNCYIPRDVVLTEERFKTICQAFDYRPIKFNLVQYNCTTNHVPSLQSQCATSARRNYDYGDLTENLPSVIVDQFFL
ncbi:ORF60 [Haliotid herpesvirus 1]|uniref:Uncharacterized protein n=1 Tax=Abalone herpesvirus Taiwan/2005 TaxID=1821058 RepID=A0A143DIA0_9VIRU|nr:hypothetical protein tc2005_p096c [Abalone herpesvirus Taiwan/2005]UCX57050.1 ORF60 [Haliotid herpesvirus 1]